MTEEQKPGAVEWVAPEVTDAFFDQADTYKSGKLIRRGRPKLESPKTQVTLRLDADVLTGLRANTALKQWLASQRRHAG